MDETDEVPYVVVHADGRFRIVDQSGRTIMTCRDRGSAEHYAELLISAFESGLRAGRRRQASD